MPAPTQSRHLLRILPALCLVFLAQITASAFQPTPASPANFNLDRDREPVVSLDGLWRFHPGDNPQWANPTFDDSSWPLLQSNQPWSTQGYTGLSGYGWYRFSVHLPASDKPRSLLLVPILTSYEVYADGHLIGTVGDMPPTLAPHAIYQFHSFPLPSLPNSSSARTIHIALRVWHSSIWASYVGGGPSRSRSLIGESSLIETELLHKRTLSKTIFVDDFVFAIAGALIGFTILGLFFYRPKDYEYLWFAILLLSLAIDAAVQIGYSVYAFLPIPIFDFTDGILIAANVSGALVFFSIVLRARRGRFWFLALVLTLLSPFTVILYWPGIASVASSAALQLLFLLPGSLWILAILIRRAFRRDGDALLLLVPTGLYIGYGFLYNIAILLSQAGLTTVPDVLLEPLPLPPFTIHWMILFDLIFLAAMLAFLIRRFSQARQGEERYAGQLEAARQVQQVLLPEAIVQVPGFVVDCIYHPAEEVGGDFFQILPTHPDTDKAGLLVVVGDVAGKGLPAAMMVSVLVGAIRTEASHTADPAAILSSLNERMFGRSQGGFTTCICLHLAANGQVTIASAGHLAPYRIENGSATEIALNPALPLGILSPTRYETSTLSLAPGQRLTLVSDGVLEAQTHSGELLGFDRTRKLSTQPAAEIAAAAQAFGQNDDITVVTIEFRGKTTPLQQNRPN